MSKCPFEGPVNVTREDYEVFGDPQEPPDRTTEFHVNENDGTTILSFEDEDCAIWLRDAINEKIARDSQPDDGRMK